VADPLVTVITPTFHRHRVLIDRCVPCVTAQTYSPVEHIIVSDVPDAYLAGCRFPDHVRYLELPEHNIAKYGRWGTGARLLGIEHARGDLIAYLDDDDVFYPDHIERMAGVLAAHPDAGFAYSQATFGGSVIGSDPFPGYAQVSTSTLMNRREILDRVTWEDRGENTIDWDIVQRWINAGVKWCNSPAVSVDLGIKGGVGYEDGVEYRQDGQYG
jgi:glycosyltransferase involved in cell wall biosynthesis